MTKKSENNYFFLYKTFLNITSAWKLHPENKITTTNKLANIAVAIIRVRGTALCTKGKKHQTQAIKA
jgi:hypothetical protein